MLDTLDKNAQEIEELFTSSPAKQDLTEAQIQELASLVDQKTLYTADGWLHLYHELMNLGPAQTHPIDWKTRKKIRTSMTALSCWGRCL